MKKFQEQIFVKFRFLYIEYGKSQTHSVKRTNVYEKIRCLVVRNISLLTAKLYWREVVPLVHVNLKLVPSLTHLSPRVILYQSPDTHCMQPAARPYCNAIVSHLTRFHG